MSRRRCFSNADGSDVAFCLAKKNCFALPVVVVVEVVVKSNISAELMPMQTKSNNALDALSFIARIYNLLRAIPFPGICFTVSRIASMLFGGRCGPLSLS